MDTFVPPLKILHEYTLPADARHRIYSASPDWCNINTAGADDESEGSELLVSLTGTKAEVKVGASYSTTIKSLTFPGQITDATWCEFQNGSISGQKTPQLDKCMVILSAHDYIHCYAQNGAVYEIPLPFSAEKIWSCKYGLLIEKVETPSNHLETMKVPTLFSLTHPLDEVKPAIEMTGQSEEELDGPQKEYSTTTKDCFFSSSDERLIDVDEISLKSILGHTVMSTYERVSGTVKLWYVGNQAAMSARYSRETRFLWHGQLDEDEIRPIEPALFVKPIWSFHLLTKDMQKDAVENVFAASVSESEKLIIGLFQPRQKVLQVLTAQPMATELANLHCQEIPCISALPIVRKSTRQMWVDFIVLDLSNQLVLYSNMRRLHSWDLSFLSKGYILSPENAYDTAVGLFTTRNDVMLMSPPQSEDNQGVGLNNGLKLRHACGKSFSVCLPNGFLRMSLCLKFKTSMLEGLFETLDDLVHDLAHSLRVDVLHVQYRASQPEQSFTEWEAFEIALLAVLIGTEPFTVAHTGEARKTNILTSWESIQASHYHADYDTAGVSLFSGFKSRSLENTLTRTWQKKFSCAQESKKMISFITEKYALMSSFNIVFQALHIAYEEAKLSRVTSSVAYEALPILLGLSRAFGLQSFVQHYERDCGVIESSLDKLSIFDDLKYYLLTEDFFKSVTNYSKWFSEFPKGKQPPTVPTIVEEAAQNSLWKKISTISGAWCEEGVSRLQAAQSAVKLMTSLKVSLTDLAMLEPAISLPLKEAITVARVMTPTNLDRRGLEMIGREDLSLLGLHTSTSHVAPPVSEMAGMVDGLDPSVVTSLSDPIYHDPDGLKHFERLAELRFSRDQRSREVSRIVRSSRPLCLGQATDVDLSDQEQLQNQQAKLLLLCKRSMALPVARGMVTLGTMRPMLTEPLPIPSLTLTGRIPPSNATVSLDTSQFSPDLTVWPEFHNGVAAGLRLSHDVSGLTRTWIVYNKSETPSNTHAGLLLALGLQGHLSALAMTDIYEYLSQSHDVTTVAILLGLAAGKRGSLDQAVSKMLCLHIPYLLPPPFAEMEVAPMVQAAAISGIGYLYQGSGHRLMTEFLLSELGRRPSSDWCDDREAYSLAAGAALGMVNLGLGASGGIYDLQLEDRLHRLLVGGKAMADTWLGSSNPDGSRCSRVKEGQNVNIEITAPGAALALALVFLDTGNSAVAARVEVPRTLFLLDYVRPDVVLLRVLAKNLIMWKEIMPTQEWLDKQIPKEVMIALERHRDSGEDQDTHFDDDIDHIKAVYANLIAGACQSLGLRYAGTMNSQAFSLIMKQLILFKSMREHERKSGWLAPERTTLEMCLGVIAQSAALVMAGSGDLGTLRIIRELRWKIDGDVTYGNHMALSMAIGLLFLGSGYLSISRSKEAIASLVLALFSRFPANTADCHYHLQALRHLYVLATEPRVLQSIDVTSKLPCHVPIEICYRGTDGSGHKTIQAVTPFLLPSDEDIISLHLKSPRYYPLSIDLRAPAFKSAFFKRQILWVKMKEGFVSYARDPRGMANLTLRQFSGHNASGASVEQKVRLEPSARQIASSLTSDERAIVFAEYFCDPLRTQRGLHSEESSFFSDFSTAILRECIVKGATDLLGTYLHFHMLLTYAETQILSDDIRMINILLAYSAEGRGTSKGLQKEFLLQIRDRVVETFGKLEHQRFLSPYLVSGKLPTKELREAEISTKCFGAFLLFNRFSTSGQLKDVGDALLAHDISLAGILDPSLAVPEFLQTVEMR